MSCLKGTESIAQDRMDLEAASVRIAPPRTSERHPSSIGIDARQFVADDGGHCRFTLE
jgi:hypothetical protein